MLQLWQLHQLAVHDLYLFLQLVGNSSKLIACCGGGIQRLPAFVCQARGTVQLSPEPPYFLLCLLDEGVQDVLMLCLSNSSCVVGCVCGWWVLGHCLCRVCVRLCAQVVVAALVPLSVGAQMPGRKVHKS